MNTAYRRLEISDAVKRGLLDAFTAHIARHVAASIPEGDGPARVRWSDENIALVVIHKHVLALCKDWVVAEPSGLDLLDGGVRKLLWDATRRAPQTRKMQPVLTSAWASGMHEAREVHAAATADTLED